MVGIYSRPTPVTATEEHAGAKVESGAIEIRNASDGHLLLNYHHPYVTSFGWSPDSTHIASGGWNRSVQVWRVHDGQRIWFYPIPDPNDDYINHVDTIAWSPDGTRIASGGRDRFVRVWQVFKE